MPTLFEEINKYCEMGLHPIVSDSGKYIVVSPIKDSYSNWRDTSIRDSLEEATKYIGNYIGYSNSELDKKESEGWKITGFYSTPVKRFKAGDEVRVRKNLKDLQYGGDWDYTSKIYQSTAGMIGEITDVGSFSYTIYFDSLGDCFNYSHDQVEPCIEEPATPKTIDIGGKTYKVTPELVDALKNLKEIE